MNSSAATDGIAPSGGGNLYRIMSFDRAAAILSTGKLYFSHPSVWDDPFERAIIHPLSKDVFAQCWCRTAISDAMWRIYSPHGLGVRVATTRERLQRALVKHASTGDIQFA